MSKPIHIGFSVLELSKLKMTRFWYDKIIPLFGESNVRLLYSGEQSIAIIIIIKSKYMLFQIPTLTTYKLKIIVGMKH